MAAYVRTADGHAKSTYKMYQSYWPRCINFNQYTHDAIFT